MKTSQFHVFYDKTAKDYPFSVYWIVDDLQSQLIKSFKTYPEALYYVQNLEIAGLQIL